MMLEWGRGGDPLWWAALNRVDGIGAATMLRLAGVFGSPEAAVKASVEDLIARGRLTPGQAADVKSISLESLRQMISAWSQAGIGLLSIGDERYPRSLLDLRTPPPLLYLRGAVTSEDARSVAIVGTREPTREGEEITAELAQKFAQRGLTDVSGLARGIDTAGHRGALLAPTGRTIAVLGSGLLRIYPPENAELAEAVASRGCLMAEVPPDAEVNRRSLLARDRIQAALSRAVIVVQAHRECGSIVTARHAVACRRLLFAVPWTDGPFAAGWERLRQMGALPISPNSDFDGISDRILSAEPVQPQTPLL
jgi:DNA processing protein